MSGISFLTSLIILTSSGQGGTISCTSAKVFPSASSIVSQSRSKDLPSIDDLINDDLPSIKDLLAEEDLPSVEDYIEKEEIEEGTETIEDADGNTFAEV